MSESKYAYRRGYRGARTVVPDVVASELAALAEEGALRPTRVLEAATPKRARLHAAFEPWWDDALAAHEKRLEVARQLIRAIVIVTTEDDGPPLSQSVYVHVPEQEESEGKYVELSEMAEAIEADEVAEYERALEEAQRYLDAAERRFQELRRLVEGRGGRAEALAIAMQGFSTVREAVALLR